MLLNRRPPRPRPNLRSVTLPSRRQGEIHDLMTIKGSRQLLERKIQQRYGVGTDQAAHPAPPDAQREVLRPSLSETNPSGLLQRGEVWGRPWTFPLIAGGPSMFVK